jgi:phage replication O-like protein O
MANPQTEQGYTRIANEILDHISKTNLNGTQLKIVLVVWRYTYGFQRKSHQLSSSFIAKAIGHKHRSVVIKELSVLIERKIISVVGNGSRGAKILKFNKNYEEWTDCSPIGHQSSLTTNRSPELTTNRSPELTTNRSPKKENIKEKNKKNTRQQKTYDEESSYFKMATYFFSKVSAVAKEAGVEHLIRKANLQSWADDFRKLIEIDGVDKRLAKDVMDWVTQDSFWKTNVLSAKKLREKFSELAIKMNAAKKSKQSTQPQQKQKDIRDKEIEFQRFVAAGGDPDDFDWR